MNSATCYNRCYVDRKQLSTKTYLFCGYLYEVKQQAELVNYNR